MNFSKIMKSIGKAMDAIGGGWVAILIGILLLALILFLVFKSGKQLKIRVPFLPAPFNVIKLGRDPKKPPEEGGNKEPEKPLIGAMFEGIDALSGDAKKRYDLPVYLMISQDESAHELVEGTGNDILQRLSLKDRNGDESGSCVVLKHGCLVHHESPEQITAELIHSRPERPLDGVVFAVPAKDLLNPIRKARQKKLDWLFQQFWAVQKDIEFTLPVYFIVSGLEELKGFQAFWDLAELEPFQDEIFGWSSPQNFDSPFNSVWVEEAFTRAANALQDRFYDVSVRERGNDPQDAVLFLQAFRRLQAPTQEFLDGIFNSSALQHPCFFRGIYFSGSLKSGEGSQPGFLKDLFKRKIFPEYGLAIPRYDKLLSADKTLRNLQVLSLVGFTILLAWTGFNLAAKLEQKNELRVAVASVNDIWRENQGYESIRPLFGIMAHMDASEEYCCGPLPLRFGGISVNNQVENFFKEEMFSKRIFPAMECRSRQRIADLSNENKFSVTGGLLEGDFLLWLDQLVIEARTYQQLKQLMEESQATRSVNSVTEEFSELIGFLYDEELPPGFGENSDLYIEAIAENQFEIEYLSTKDCEESVGSIRDVWSQSLLAAQMDIDSEVERIAAPVGFIEALHDYESISINQVSLDRPAFSKFLSWKQYFDQTWGAGQKASFCARTRDDLSAVADVLVKNGSPRESLEAGRDNFFEACKAAVQQQMIEDNSRLPRPLYSGINDNGDLSPKISVVARRVFESISDMSKLPFASIETSSWTERSGNFYWSVDDLSKTLEFYEDYLSFADSRFETTYLPDSPSDNRETYLSQAIVLSQLQRAMLSTIENAKILVKPNERIDFKTLDRREAGIANRVSNFKKSLEPLLSLVSAFDQLGFITAKRALLLESQNQAVGLLEDIDSLFRANQIYAPRANPKWNAHQYAEAFFGLLSPIQVQDYLAAQDQRSRILALDYAQPVVIYLANTEGSFSNSDLLGRWLRTLVEINKRQNKDPSNDLEKFEQFFAGEFFETNLSNCHEQVKAFEEPLGGSMFAVMNRELVQRAVEHCLSFQADTIKQEYRLVTDAFEKYLAPFYPYNRSSTARPLSPKSLNAFLEVYGGKTDGLAERVRVLAWKYREFEQAEPFIQSLDDSLALLSEIVRNSKNEVQPGLELAVELNPRTDIEPAYDFTSHISRKALSIGRDKLQFPGAQKSLFWNFADQAVFELEWASGSPYQLLTMTGASVARKLTFQSSGYWGLLRFLEEYQSDLPDGNALYEESMLLEFSGGVKRAQQSSSITPLTSFVRVTLFGQDPETGVKTPLVMPKRFPSASPKL